MHVYAHAYTHTNFKMYVCLIRYISELRLVRVLSSEGGVYNFSASHEDASVDHFFHVYVNSKSVSTLLNCLVYHMNTILISCSGCNKQCLYVLNVNVMCLSVYLSLMKVSRLSSPRKGQLMDRFDALLLATQSLKSAGTSVSCLTRGVSRHFV